MFSPLRRQAVLFNRWTSCVSMPFVSSRPRCLPVPSSFRKIVKEPADRWDIKVRRELVGRRLINTFSGGNPLFRHPSTTTSIQHQFRTMATASQVHLDPTVRPFFAVDELKSESAQVASKLLQENHEKHHIFFNREGFHVRTRFQSLHGECKLTLTDRTT